jgi:prepilin-type N-terminal cleavage/methylation domain-containing protein
VRKAFTLIELLIVVAIIAILAAIAVPNFLEAQVRAKAARAKSDMRSLATAVETYRIDNNAYPDGTDSASGYDKPIADFLTPLGLQSGYYGFRSRTSAGGTVGKDFAGVTTPIAYITTIPKDPFAGKATDFMNYCYRSAKVTHTGYILTSVGPDSDLLAAGGKGTNNPNVLGTRADPKSPSRLGDINEEMTISLVENTPKPPATAADVPKMRQLLQDLEYDPTNGTSSDGDLYRIGP